jgi:hypothetical protein
VFSPDLISSIIFSHDSSTIIKQPKIIERLTDPSVNLLKGQLIHQGKQTNKYEAKKQRNKKRETHDSSFYTTI